jgi:hypothetical protein
MHVAIDVGGKWFAVSIQVLEKRARVIDPCPARIAGETLPPWETSQAAGKRTGGPRMGSTMRWIIGVSALTVAFGTGALGLFGPGSGDEARGDGVASGELGSGNGQDPRPATWITAHWLTAHATHTSTCGYTAEGEFCAEERGRLRGRLPVRARSRVRVRTRPGAGQVRAHLVRVRPNGQIRRWVRWKRRAREVDGTEGRRWRFGLPGARKLGRANAVHLFIHYPEGVSYPGGVIARQATYTQRITIR